MITVLAQMCRIYWVRYDQMKKAKSHLFSQQRRLDLLWGFGAIFYRSRPRWNNGVVSVKLTRELSKISALWTAYQIQIFVPGTGIKKDDRFIWVQELLIQ